MNEHLSLTLIKHIEQAIALANSGFDALLLARNKHRSEENGISFDGDAHSSDRLPMII